MKRRKIEQKNDIPVAPKLSTRGGIEKNNDKNTAENMALELKMKFPDLIRERQENNRIEKKKHNLFNAISKNDLEKILEVATGEMREKIISLLEERKK